MKELGIYVHIPFCVKKCKYCNFNSYPGMEEYQFDYIKALCKEIKHYSKDLKDRVVTSIFIGGGTPSHLVNGGISTILSEIRKEYNLSDDAEITIESNPNSITLEKAYEWKNAGVNRVSVGLQTYKNNLLNLIGRAHTKQDYINAMKTLKDVGFININTDIMIGLPAQKQSDVRATLRQVVKYGSTHVSAYTLILEENTPLHEEVMKGKVKLPKENKVLGMYNYVKKYLSNMGFERYEVSNFSKPNMKCRHNVNCWKMIDYIGFGAGAHSFIDGSRHYNISDVKEYLSKSPKKEWLEVKETLSQNELFEESILLGLRLTNGIDLAQIKEKYNIDLLKSKKELINKYIALGYLKLEDNMLSATDEGFNVLNKLILDLVD